MEWNGALSDTWGYHFHDPLLDDWSRDSYEYLGNFSTAQQFWGIHDIIESALPYGCFFLHRQRVFPSWDDPAHCQGGCLSMQVSKPHIPHFFTDLAVRILLENCPTPASCISVSPKKHFCIIKIWLPSQPNMVQDLAWKEIIPGYYQGEIKWSAFSH